MAKDAGDESKVPKLRIKAAIIEKKGMFGVGRKSPRMMHFLERLFKNY